MRELRRATAQSVYVGPFISKTDGATYYTPGAAIPDANIFIIKNSGASYADSAPANRGATTTTGSISNYHALIVLGTDDTATTGRFRIFITGQEANALPVWEDFEVLPESIYDAKYGVVAGTSAVTELELSHLHVTNPTGDAVVFQSGGGGGNGLTLMGNAGGHGMYSLGGATDGAGILATGCRSGEGLRLNGGTDGGSGAGSGNGFQASSYGTGHGILGSTVTSGYGMKLIGHTGGAWVLPQSGTNANAINIASDGSGNAISISGGTTGIGVLVSGGATSGIGVSVIGVGASGHAVKLTGGNGGASAAGSGLWAQSGTSNVVSHEGSPGINTGITAICAANNGDGVFFQGAGEGCGMDSWAGTNGAGHGMDIRGATGAGTGAGLYVRGASGGTSRGAIDVAATASNANAVTLLGTGTGNGVSVTSGSGAGAHGVAIITAAASGAGHGISVTASSASTGAGVYVRNGSGATGNAIDIAALTTAGSAVLLTGKGTAGYGLSVVTSAANAINLAPVGGGGLYCTAPANYNGIGLSASGTGNALSLASTATTTVGYGLNITSAGTTGGTAVNIANSATGAAKPTVQITTASTTAGGNAIGITATAAGSVAPALLISTASTSANGNAVAIKSTGVAIAETVLISSAATGAYNAVNITSSGASPTIIAQNSATGSAIQLKGGSTSGSAVVVSTTSGIGIDIVPTAGIGVRVTGASNYSGVSVTGSGAAGAINLSASGSGANAVQILASDGTGISVSGTTGAVVSGTGVGAAVSILSSAGTGAIISGAYAGVAINGDQATNGDGLIVTGNGTGKGVSVIGGSTGGGVAISGGSSSGAAINIAATADNAVTVASTGGHGISVSGASDLVNPKNAINLTGNGKGSALYAINGVAATRAAIHVESGASAVPALQLTAANSSGAAPAFYAKATQSDTAVLLQNQNVSGTAALTVSGAGSHDISSRDLGGDLDDNANNHLVIATAMRAYDSSALGRVTGSIYDSVMDNVDSTLSQATTAATQSTTAATQSTSANSIVGNATYGNSAIKTELDSIQSSVGGPVTLAALQPNYAPAKAGDQMDLVNAPNSTAVTAIQSGLATASNLSTVGGNVSTIKSDVESATYGLAAIKTELDAVQAAQGDDVTLAASQPNYAPAKAGDKMDLVNAPNTTAITAIQSGLATSSALSTVGGNVSTIKSDVESATYGLSAIKSAVDLGATALDLASVSTKVDNVKAVVDLGATASALSAVSTKVDNVQTKANSIYTDMATASALGTVGTNVGDIKSEVNTLYGLRPASMIASQSDVLGIVTGTRAIQLATADEYRVPSTSFNAYKLEVIFRDSSGALANPSGAVEIAASNAAGGASWNGKLYNDSACTVLATVVGGWAQAVSTGATGTYALYIKIASSESDAQLQIDARATDNAVVFQTVAMPLVATVASAVTANIADTDANKTVIAKAIRSYDVDAAGITLNTNSIEAKTESAISASTTAVNDHVDDQLALSVTAINDHTGIATAGVTSDVNSHTDLGIAGAVSDVNSNTDTQVSGAVTSINGHTDTAVSGVTSDVNDHTDAQVSAAVIDINSHTDSATSSVTADVENAIDTAVNTITGSIGDAADDINLHTDGQISALQLHVDTSIGDSTSTTAGNIIDARDYLETAITTASGNLTKINGVTLADATLQINSLVVDNGIDIHTIDGSTLTEFIRSIKTMPYGTVADVNSTTEFTASVSYSGMDKTYVGRVIIFTSGSLRNTAITVKDYISGMPSTFTTDTVPGALSSGDTFIIV